MTVILEIPPNVETALLSQAEARGVTVESYLLALATRQALASEDWAEGVTLATEPTIAELWDTPEEDAAWRHL